VISEDLLGGDEGTSLESALDVGANVVVVGFDEGRVLDDRLGTELRPDGGQLEC